MRYIPLTLRDEIDTTGSPGKVPSRRNERARLAVLHAADDLMVERGYRSLTIEGIANRAGVAKQTIYRWWPSKMEILLDVLQDDSGDIAIPEDSSSIEEVRDHLHRLAGFLTDEPAGKVLLALLGEAQQNFDVAKVFAARWADPQRQAELEMLRRCVEAGSINPDTDLDELLDFLTGPIYFRAITGRPISSSFIDAQLDRI